VPAIVVGLIACALYSHFFVFKAYLEVDIETESRLRTVLRVYWAEENTDYSQRDSAVERVYTGRDLYTGFLGDLANTNRIRIDPVEFAGRVVIRGLRLSQPGFSPIELSPSELLSKLQPVQQIENLRLISDGIVFDTTGSDGQFELAVSADKTEAYIGHWLLMLAIIFALVLIAEKCLRKFGKDHGWVVIGLGTAMVFIAVMAVLTRFGTHPDEFVHWQAVWYYTRNFLPPALNSPDIADTFSVYGYSRLANFEVFYQLAGYSVTLLQDLRIPLYLKSRLFNCLLFLALVVFAARNKDFRVVAIPLLISAQAWYLFSYINSDAFGLFVGMLVAYQGVSRGSLLNRILSDPELKYKWLAMVSIGLLLGLILVVKTNYYFFALFVGLYFLWRLFYGDFSDRKLFWSRGVVLAIIALVPYGTRLAMDMHANGFGSEARSTVRLEMNEKYAQTQFKPSTPLEEKHAYLSLKERGASVKRMLHRELWHTKTQYSAFGVFGYTQYFSTAKFYSAVTTIGMLLLGVMLVSILLRGPPSTHGLFVLAGFSALALMVSLFWYSWAISFQPQGRYLAAILPMLGMLLFEIRRYLFPRVFEGLVLTLFLMSAYVFLFVGVAEIQKIDSVSNVFV